MGSRYPSLAKLGTGPRYIRVLKKVFGFCIFIHLGRVEPISDHLGLSRSGRSSEKFAISNSG